jgi:diguanylate cyclase (GGDEF)-like protein
MKAKISRNPAGLAAVCAVEFALGMLGSAASGFSDGRVTIWPASGFAIAALILFGVRMWPGVFAGAALAYLTTSGLVSSSLTFAMGQTAGALIGAVLVERFARGQHVFDSPNSIFRFVAIAGLITTPLGAALAALAVPTAVNPQATVNVGELWRNWWLAGLTGTVVVAPFTILWLTSLGSRVRWRELGESLMILSVLTVACLVLFGGWFRFRFEHYPVHFISVPFLLWVAFRLGRRGMATSILILSAVAFWGTLRGFGPLAQMPRNLPMDTDLVQAFTTMMAVTGIVLAAVVAQHRRAEEQLLALATTDSLTGLANHRRLLEVLRAEMARSGRTGRPFVVAFMDMDELKSINDKFGHLVGSRAICRVAEALRSSCRAMDTPARYGGDEFAVVLPETTEAGGRAVLERIAARLAADVNGPRLSVSGGVALFPRDGDSPTLLLRAADRLLYEAKAVRSAARGHDRLPPASSQAMIG